MKSFNFFLFLLLLVFTACSSLVKEDSSGLQVNDPEKRQHPYVIMISLDGFRHDYVNMYKPPFLSKIINKGVQSKSLVPIFPSKTFPNHYSLITGLYAENHGLVANRFYDPEMKEAYQLGDSVITRDGKWYRGRPLWLSVRDQGLLSASFFWVGSDANIGGHYPNYYVPYDGNVPNRTRTTQALKWLQMEPDKRPHFITLYFSDVDSMGHRHGPESPEVREAVMKVDREIEFLAQEVEKLNLPVNFVIVSDHGMKSIDPNKKIYLKNYVDTDKAIFKEKGPISLVYLKDPKDIPEFYNALTKAPFLSIYQRDDLPKRFHYSKNPRSGDIILLADPGAYIYPEKEEPEKKLTKEEIAQYSAGTHGYDPMLSKAMHGIFMSFGPQVRNKGVIPSFENIHVYPFVMNLLGLEVKEKIDGNPSLLAPYVNKSATP